MKKKYLRSKNWHYVRFCNDINFGYNLQGKFYNICKSNKQYCLDYIQDDIKEGSGYNE